MNDFTRRNWRCRLLQFNPPSRPPAQPERHSIHFARRAKKSSARRDEGKKGRPRLCKYKKRYLFSWERKELLAFLKFMSTDVPSAYACIRILCGCREGSVMPRNSRETIALKKGRQTHRRDATPISSPSRADQNGFFHSIKYRTILSHSIQIDAHKVSIFIKEKYLITQFSYIYNFICLF